MILLLAGMLSFAQLSGIKSVPGDYPTLASAITALNSSGVGPGGVIFNVAAGYTETFLTPTAGLITTSTASSSNPILIRKSGSGANPLITAGTGTGSSDYIICISGLNSITIDGIDVRENPANITPLTQMEWGFAIMKASETQGSKNVIIRNCNVSLDMTNPGSTGIYMDNVIPSAPTVQLTISSASGTNSGNKFYNNNITNVYTGIYISGFADVTPPYAFYDQNNDIGSIAGNTITSFGGGPTTVYAIYAAYQNGLTISNSAVNGGTGTSGNLYGIYGGTAKNANVSIYGNTVTLSSSGNITNLYGIYNAGLGDGGMANTLNFYNNSVINCTYPTAGAVIFYGIYNVATAGTINVYGNLAQNNIIGGTSQQYLIYTNSTAGNNVNVYNNIVSGNQCSGTGIQSDVSYIFGIQTIGWGNMSIHDNQVFNNSIPNQTLYGGVIYGIHSGFSASNSSIFNNSVHDLSVGSSATRNTNHIIYGIYASLNSFTNATTNSIHDNSFYNLALNLNSAQNGYIYGINSNYFNNIYSNTISNIQFTNTLSGYGYGAGINYSSGGTGQIYKNNITNVSMAGTSAYFNGIYVSSGDNVFVYNNFISDLRTPNSTSATALSGIYVGNQIQTSLFYNTIYLNASSTSTANFGTSGVYASTTPGLELRNNLIVNTSSAPASTTYKTAAFRRSSTSFSTYSNASNYNDFFAGTPSATNLIFYDGTNSLQTLAAFKSYAVQRDANSVTELPPFVNITASPFDLHLKSIIPNQCESGGSVVSGTLNITSDIDGEPRYPNPGYPVQAGYPPSAPDMGADEFGGIPLDLTPPSIIFTPLSKTSSTSARTLTATIKDVSGVPTSGPGRPVLYWKKFASGSWNSAPASWVSGNTYTFTFGGGVALYDSVYYYVAAQDIATPNPNVGATPLNGSGYTTSPPACSVPPPNASCYSYKIVGSLCGTYNIGAGQAYTTITSAINDLNNLEVTCPVVFQLTDATYPSETFPLTINNPTGVSVVNTVTIRPASGVTPTIQGSASCIIKFNSASNITIDGSNSGGTDRSLSISNTVTSGTNAVIWIGSNGANNGSANDIIRNCNISNGYLTSTSYVIFIGSSAALGSTGDDNDNITIQNNSISKAYRGIYCQASTNGLNDGLRIINNVIGSDVSTGYISNYGIYLAGVNAPVVSGNVIYNMMNSIAVMICGIELNSNVLNAMISNNLIHDLRSSSSSGPSVYGINIGTGFNVVNASLINNVIYNISSTRYALASTQYNPFGIRVVSGSGHKLYHNTVYVSGSQSGPGTSGSLSAAIVFPYPIVSGLDIRNNIFANDLTGLAGSSSYCIYAVAGTNFGTIDNNDYYPSGAFGILGYLGAAQTTLAAWKAATGQDANSVNTDPVFTSPSNLIPTTSGMPHAGVYINSVPTDITGINRTNPPDIGAYEFTVNPVITTIQASAVINNSVILNGNANASGTTFNLFFDMGTTNSYGNSYAASPATTTGNSLISINRSLSGLLPLTTYHYRARGVTSAALTVYGNDMTFTTLADPPSVVTLAATSITAVSAVLNGTVNANNAASTPVFEWGLTTAYGNLINAVPSSVGGSAVTPVSASLTGLLPNTTYHYRARATNSTGTSVGLDFVFTTPPVVATVITSPATPVGNTTATLNGTVTANNSATNVTFEWGLTTAYGNIVTASPASVNGMNPTTVQVNLNSLAWSTLYHYRCVGLNSAGSAYGADLTFTTSCPVPGIPGAISGPPSVCQNQANVIFSVAPVINTTVYNWSVPAGATVISGAGTTTITVNFSPASVSGSVSVTASNSCMTGGTANMPLVVNPMPSPAISGPVSACALSTGNIYTTQAGMTGYTWNVSAGGTITAGAGTNNITVTWNTAGANIVSVNYSNANGCSAASPFVYNVTVNGLPIPTITGSGSMCAGSGYYTYTTDAGQSNYNWTVSPGGTIYSGTGTNSIQVMWNAAGAQTVSVNYTNASGCQAVNPAVYNVTVNGVPSAAGTITGSAAVCAGSQGISYSVAPVQGALAYAWSLPPGVSVVSGANTNSIIVDFGINAVSGTITVAGNNLCGNGALSPAFSVAVNAAPAAAGTISGPASVCNGETNVVYTVPPMLNANAYTWTVPAGATITAGATTNSIHVTYTASAVSGNVTVYGSNTCGNGGSSSLAIAVHPVPAEPNVTASGYVLTSSAPAGNQWYHDGTQVPGATGQTFTVPASDPGWYWTIVTLNGCPSDPSNHVYIAGVGIEEQSASAITIYPVPNDGKFNIAICSPRETTYKLEIINETGVMIYNTDISTAKGNTVTAIDPGAISGGLYTVILYNAGKRVIHKIIVNR